jgi:Glycosyltransferase family 9 (heptosyltransferase)
LRTPHPNWDGKPAPHKTLLLHVGHDDGRHLILLARYIPHVAAQFRKLIFMCPEAHAPILATVRGVAQIRKPGDLNVSEFDTQVALESLPWLLGTTTGSVPPFDAGIDLNTLQRRAPGSASLQEIGTIRVGLVRANVAAASPSTFGLHSPCRIEAFDSLLTFADVAYYDLTAPLGRDAALHRPKNLRALECLADNTDLTDLALVIAQLDLIIGVDSAAVHLAGALGRPVWVLLGSVHDWCWPAAAEGSPWYPTARIFRQPMPGDQDGLLESVRSAFAAWLKVGEAAVGSSSDSAPVTR